MAKLQDQLVELLPVLRRYACSLTGNVADGDDLVQQAIVKALASQDRFDKAREARSWMFTIMKNQLIDQKRASARRGVSIDIDDQHDLAGQDGRIIAEQRQSAGKVMQAMAGLSSPQQEIAFHVLVEGRSYRETAEILDLPIGTVMSSLSRARKHLSERVLGSGRLQ